ncbi:hypothetical protein HCJ45_09505 [Listeria sp. FSL L7-1517]|uniref:hypothetical protein n=1 Tax=Listeria immobilis TaxID=2713502 RepID=UPI00164DF91F|nr:hypothetical protein [Listeria immobilis]MBC6297343.1 hypothetical protein [Listeria immobilis]
MLNQAKEQIQNVGNEYMRRQQVIDSLITKNVDNPAQYVFGLAQVESKTTGLLSIIMQVVFNRVTFHNIDYIIGADETNNELIILELDTSENVINKTIFESGSLCIKKHSRIVSEMLNKRDRYNREKFDFSNGQEEFILLVGKKSMGDSKYYYDNAPLMKSLNTIKKNIK